MDEKLKIFLDDKFRDLEVEIVNKLDNILWARDQSSKVNNLIFDRTKRINEDLIKFNAEVKRELQEMKDLIEENKPK